MVTRATCTRQAGGQQRVSRFRLLAHVNGRDVTTRGLRGRLRCLRNELRSLPTDALQDLRMGSFVYGESYTIRPPRQADTLPEQAYQDLCSLVGAIRATTFLLKHATREWLRRQAAREAAQTMPPAAAPLVFRADCGHLTDSAEFVVDGEDVALCPRCAYADQMAELADAVDAADALVSSAVELVA